MLLILKSLLTLAVTDVNPADYGYDLYDYVPIPEPTYQEIVLAKLKEIVTTGFTIEEFQKAMIFICLMRFIIYSIKYNPITSFKISAIGFVSCVLWGIALNDCVGVYYPILEFNPLLTNILNEETLFREEAEMRAYYRIGQTMFRQMSGDIYHFQWIKPVFDLLPEKYNSISGPIYEYITRDLLGVVQKFYKSNIRQLMPFIIYIGWVRVGKKYCPYHIRWHFTFVTLYNSFITYIFSCTLRAKFFISSTLIPQGRIEEAIDVQIYLGAVAFVHITFVMLAMLHAVFSQYFYVPFLTYSVELHIGKRPVKSIYSGGYTSWQDDFLFYNIKFRESMRLWWGFLGRGTKKQREKRKKNRRKKK